MFPHRVAVHGPFGFVSNWPGPGHPVYNILHTVSG